MALGAGLRIVVLLLAIEVDVSFETSAAEAVEAIRAKEARA